MNTGSEVATRSVRPSVLHAASERPPAAALSPEDCLLDASVTGLPCQPFTGKSAG
jgi:hypothetical protein